MFHCDAKVCSFLVFVINTHAIHTPDIREIKTQQPANYSPYTICLPPPRTSDTDRVCVPRPCGRTDRVCVCVTRGVIVQAHSLPTSGSAYPTQHNMTYASTRTHAERERERERRREARTHVHTITHTNTHTQAHTHTHTQTHTHTHTRVHTHTYIRVKRTHLHVGVSHSCKPVCDSVHVPAQAMNSINLGVKRWKEPSLIAFIGQLPVVVLYAIFGIPQHIRRRLRALCHLSRWRAWCVRNPDEQVMHIALAPTQASPPLHLPSKSMDSDGQCSATAVSLPAPSAPIPFPRRFR